MSGQSNPPADDKIVEIAEKLKLTEPETQELIVLAASDRAKFPATKELISKMLLHDRPDNAIALKAEEHTIPIYTTIKAGNGEMGIINTGNLAAHNSKISVGETLSPQETEVIRLYRSLPPKDQARFLLDLYKKEEEG